MLYKLQKIKIKYTYFLLRLLIAGTLMTKLSLISQINIDPESLKPKLPSRKDLKPYPSMCYLEYRGHSGPVKSISVEISGQWIASGWL